MFRGVFLSSAFFLFCTQAQALTCKLIFKPFEVVQVLVPQKSSEAREISGEVIQLLYSQKVVETNEVLFKLQQLLAENKFLYEALENLSYSQKYLDQIVQKKLTSQMRAVEMAYASGTSQVYMGSSNQKLEVSKNKKVVSLAEVRKKRAEEERAEYEAYISENYSKVNYGFFQQMYQFLSIIHYKINNSPTLKLSKTEIESLKEVADNFTIYSNYILSKEIMQSFENLPKNFRIQLTAVLSRSPKIKDKFIEHLSFMDIALQDQRFEDVISSNAVQRVQQHLLAEVKAIHIEGSEKRYESVIHYLEGLLGH